MYLGGAPVWIRHPDGLHGEVHRTYISQLERGLKSPTLSMMLKLSRALKVSASRLVATVEKAIR